MQGHAQDVRKLIIKDRKSDSFADHFAKLIPDKTPHENIRKFVRFKVDILWKGNPLAVVKTFGTRGCKLCARERLEILKMSYNNPQQQINKCSEIYGACRHKPRFHRFDQTQLASTDEAGKAEKVTKNQKEKTRKKKKKSPKKSKNKSTVSSPDRASLSDQGESTNESTGTQVQEESPQDTDRPSSVGALISVEEFEV